MIADLEKEKTEVFPDINFTDRETPYLESQILSEPGQVCVLFEPQKNSKKRKIDLKRLEYSSELL